MSDSLTAAIVITAAVMVVRGGWGLYKVLDDLFVGSRRRPAIPVPQRSALAVVAPDTKPAVVAPDTKPTGAKPEVDRHKDCDQTSTTSAQRYDSDVERWLPLDGAPPECAWCSDEARGIAQHPDGSQHPSCGQDGHGYQWKGKAFGL